MVTYVNWSPTDIVEAFLRADNAVPTFTPPDVARFWFWQLSIHRVGASRMTDLRLICTLTIAPARLVHAEDRDHRIVI